MKKLLIVLTLLASMPSFAKSVGEIEAELNQDICGNNFPSIYEAFNEYYDSNAAIKLTRFQHSIQYVAVAVDEIHQIQRKAMLKKDYKKGELAKKSVDGLAIHYRTMVRQYTAEYQYEGLVNLCSYLNNI